jgi:hypothetical protein
VVEGELNQDLEVLEDQAEEEKVDQLHQQEVQLTQEVEVVVEVVVLRQEQPADRESLY